MRLVGLCGMNAEPTIHFAIKGERYPLFTFPFLWRFLISNRRVPALRYPSISRAVFSIQQSIEGNGFLRH